MSVRKRKWKTKDGFSTVWLVTYRDQNGDRAQKQFETKQEAVNYHATVHVKIIDGTYVSASRSPTVADAGETWIARVKANGMNDEGPVERTTLSQYRQHLDLHIAPRIGETKVGALSKETIEKFRSDLLDKLSRPLAAKVFTSFKSILKAAGCNHLVANFSVKNKKRHKRRIEAGTDFPTPTEVKRLIDALEPDDLRRRALLFTVAFTGLRSSELRGLRWKDVDFRAIAIKVTQRADRHNEIGATKTVSSARTVPADTLTLDTLRAWKVNSPYSKPDDLVFATRTGKPKAQDKLLDELKSIMIEAKLTSIETKKGKDVVVGKYGLHAMRHFFASWCINEENNGGRGMPPKQVQELMGHSSIVVTYDIYGHLFPNQSNRAELDKAVRRLLQ